MYDPENDRRELAARRAKRKASRRADKARRAAAIEAAWMQHMWALTPAEAAEAAQPAEPSATTPATPDAAVVEWPDNLPRPGEGRRFPSVRRLARWLGVHERNFAPDEVTAMVSAWAVAAQAAGVQVNVSVEPGTPPSRPAVRPQRSGKAS